MTPKQHMQSVASKPCLVCHSVPVQVHHVTATKEGVRITRNDYLTAPLCPRHHQYQHGPTESVEALGHGSFAGEYGIDLLAWAYWNAPSAFRHSDYFNTISGTYVTRSLGLRKDAA